MQSINLMSSIPALYFCSVSCVHSLADYSVMRDPPLSPGSSSSSDVGHTVGMAVPFDLPTSRVTQMDSRRAINMKRSSIKVKQICPV